MCVEYLALLLTDKCRRALYLVSSDYYVSNLLSFFVKLCVIEPESSFLSVTGGRARKFNARTILCYLFVHKMEDYVPLLQFWCH